MDSARNSTSIWGDLHVPIKMYRVHFNCKLLFIIHVRLNLNDARECVIFNYRERKGERERKRERQKKERERERDIRARIEAYFNPLSTNLHHHFPCKKCQTVLLENTNALNIYNITMLNYAYKYIY